MKYQDLLSKKRELAALLDDVKLTERVIAGENPSKDELKFPEADEDEIPQELWQKYFVVEKSGKSVGIDIPNLPDDVTADKLQDIIGMIEQEIRNSKPKNGKAAKQEAFLV